MAFLIPSKLPSSCSRGEERLHALLGSLPANCIVYYEPEIRGRRPDFIVLCPTLGILVIEVKGWFGGNIESGNTTQVRYKRGDHAAEETHPVRQAVTYRNRLLDEMKSARFAPYLTHQSGTNAGRPLFPIGHCAILSNMSDSKLDEKRPDGTTLRDIFPIENNLSKDDIDRWESMAPESLLAHFTRYFDPYWPIPPMAEFQIEALRALVHPEIFLNASLLPEAPAEKPQFIREDSNLLKVLDLRQEDFANSIGTGHRIIYGVAGSGKTLILIAAAKATLAANPDAKLLMVCYNRSLAAWLRNQLLDFPGVTVLNFHRWASRNGAPCQFGKPDSDTEMSERLLERLTSGSLDSAAFDTILVDEAQDFEPDWFRCLLAAMKDPVDGDLVIVADGAQGLYRRSKVTWSDLGIKARGRTTSTRFHLNQNYRNTREIVMLSSRFLAAAELTDSKSDNTILTVPTNISLCLRSSGTMPLLFQVENRRAELVQAFRIIRNLLDGLWDGKSISPLEPHEIGVFYPGANDAERIQLREFTDGISKNQIPAVWLSDPDKPSRDAISHPGLKIQTIHSAKGLQYRAVVILWADKLPGNAIKNQADRIRADRRLFYVGITRAETFLAITASNSSDFIQDIIESGASQACQPLSKAKKVPQLFDVQSG